MIFSLLRVNMMFCNWISDFYKDSHVCKMVGSSFDNKASARYTRDVSRPSTTTNLVGEFGIMLVISDKLGRFGAEIVL